MPTNKTEQCAHEKVYASYILTSHPPQQPWVCRLCGEEGIDRLGGKLKTDEYEKTKRHFKAKRRKNAGNDTDNPDGSD